MTRKNRQPHAQMDQQQFLQQGERDSGGCTVAACYNGALGRRIAIVRGANR
jgi:hypothetical protein